MYHGFGSEAITQTDSSIIESISLLTTWNGSIGSSCSSQIPLRWRKGKGG
jgi:hypothetical protein